MGFGVEFLEGAGGNVSHGNQSTAFDVGDLVLPGLANVENDGAFGAGQVEQLLQILRRYFIIKHKDQDTVAGGWKVFCHRYLCFAGGLSSVIKVSCHSKSVYGYSGKSIDRRGRGARPDGAGGTRLGMGISHRDGARRARGSG